MLTEEEIEAFRQYDRNLRKYLADAMDGDYVVCPSSKDLTPEIAEAAGIDSIKDICVECGTEVTRSNIETKAKIICMDCYKKRVTDKLETGVGM